MKSAYPLIPFSEVLAAPLANGRSVPTAEAGFPVLRLTALRDNGVDVNEYKIGRWTRDEASTYFIQQGDLLIARGNGSLDKVGRGSLVRHTSHEVAFPDTIIRAKVRHEIMLPEFLALMWNSPAIRRQIESQARTTAGIYKINQAHLKKILIPAPPLDQQYRIVDIAEDLFARMDQASHNLTLGINKAITLGPNILANKLDGIPCVATKLANLISSPIRNGRSVPTQEDGFPVLRLTALRQSVVDLREHKMGAWSRDAARDYIVKEGDFLVSRGNGSRKLVGRGSLVGETSMEVAYPDTMFRIRPSQEIIHPHFLALAWNSSNVRHQIEQRARTTAGIYKINQSDLRSISLLVPDICDQLRIIDSVAVVRQTLDHCIETAGVIRAKSQALRGSILSAAFEGHLVQASKYAISILDHSSVGAPSMIPEASLT